MGRYDRYILSQLLVLFGFFSLVLVSVYMVNRAVDLFDTLIADGQNVMVFLELTALTMPRVILLAVPVSAFVATLYIFNRMISESEMVVLQTSGVSGLRLLRPVIVFALFLALLVALLANILAPAARTQFVERSAEISQDMTGRFLRDGQFLSPTPGLTVFISEITEFGEFRDVFLQDRSVPEREITYVAQRALLVRSEAGPRLVMFDGTAQTLIAPGNRLTTVDFEDFAYDVGALVEVPEDRRLLMGEVSTLTLLRADPGFAEEQGFTLPAMLFAGHDRLARPLFAFFLPLIAAGCLMLGSFSRFGVWPQILLAVMLVVPLQMIWNFAEATAPRQAGLWWMAYLQPLLAAAIAAGTVTVGMMRKRRPRGMRWAT